MNIPEGWKLVPVEPTTEMLAALRIGSRRDAPNDELCEVRYRAMLANVPTPPVQQDDEALDRIAELEAENERLRAELAEVKRDAERYRWLRAQHWEASVLSVVSYPREAVKLGHDCPSMHRLDSIIDTILDAIAAQEPGHAR